MKSVSDFSPQHRLAAWLVIAALCSSFCAYYRLAAALASNQTHWSFTAPVRPSLPLVRAIQWPRNEMDFFVLARLENERLSPSSEADKATLIRRVTLDLTGLPPTVQEVDAFLADVSSDAYEKLVDRLLASPRFGERMAVRWLDAARYADTSGYQTDGERSMWRWRDWVIDAFNQNKPFDEFTVEQLAGDLLPNPTLDQRIATGFNRNHRGNSEGGIIPEEYAVEYVVDRVDTACTVWLGLTMGCARCHDHKYDPFTQREFYQLFAFFNNVPEKGRAVKLGNSPPFIKAPTAQQQARLAELERKLADAEKQFLDSEPELKAAETRWERTIASRETGVGSQASREHRRGDPNAMFEASPPADWSISRNLVAHFPLARDTHNRASPTNNAKFVAREEVFANTRLRSAADLDGHRWIEAANVGRFGFLDKFSCSAWILSTASRGTILSRMVDAARGEGFSLVIENGKVQVNLVKRWLDDALRVETERALESNEWYHLLFTYDGSREATGVRIYVNGRLEKLKIILDELNQSFETAQPFRIGAGGGPESRFRGWISDVRIYDRVITPEEAEVLTTFDSIQEITAIAPERRTSGQTKKIRTYFLEEQAPAGVRGAWRDVIEVRRHKEEFFENLPTVMVMEEMKPPRDTFVLVRGQYDKPGEKVSPGVPARISPWPNGVEHNRLGFAKWLVSPSNPLTARVAVNQFWQMYFGAGLVKTMEDFGARGERPSHPQLLDWLATEFMRTGWNVKALQKLIVMSATYRQASMLRPELVQKDPENRLLARTPRLRLPPEIIRDQALAMGGLLVEKAGGPSVKPYQPSGLWKELSGTDYTQDNGENLYRRSLYTFWKRTSPPPTMMTFDAAGREACSVRQSRTSTPLQSLALMNEVTFVEAARMLAQRMMIEGGTTPEKRLEFGFRLATARWPRGDELAILAADFADHLQFYRKHPDDALKLTSVGETARCSDLDVRELAAYTATANLLLNLDETITKQ